MSQSVYSVSDAWWAFNGLYREAAEAAFPTNRSGRRKRKQQQLRKRISKDWGRIKTDHPDGHVELKLDLGHVIRRINAADVMAERAYSNIDARRASGLSEPVELHEDLIRARVRALAALNDLVMVERRVGRAADFIMAYADREIALLKRSIRTTGDYVASCRRDEEYDEYGSFIRRDAFQKKSQPTPLPGGQQWHGNIASGPMSCVGLLLSGDQHNRIVDRFVMKDVWLNIHPNLWTHPAFWYGDPLDPTSKAPYEVHIMARLNRLSHTAAGHEHVLRMRAWHMVPENLMYRILLEYCPNGSAYNLLDHYWALNMTNRHRNSQQPDRYIPEPAIWYIFNSLIKAGLTMEQVSVDEDDPTGAQNLGEVVHLDIKPHNIFLSDYPRNDPKFPSDNFAIYPTCKLGDFGMSTYRHLAKHRTKSYIGRGTAGFFAPEQRLEYHAKERPHLNAKTNVWGVGCTLMALMNLDFSAGALQFREARTNELDPLLVPAFTPAAISEYSGQLRHLVRSCVQYRQDDRPDFATLSATLRHCTVSTPGMRDYALGARSATMDALPAGLTLLDGLPANNYALGIAMPA